MTGQKWLLPLIDTFVRGLPNIYRKYFPDDINSIVVLCVEDISNARWILKNNDPWELFVGESSEYTSKVIMNADTAWRMFSKNITKEEAKQRITFEGDKSLGEIIVELTTYIK